MSNNPRSPFELPANIVVPIVGIKELGEILANVKGLSDGAYDVVIEYKIGSGQMPGEDGQNIPAMAFTFGGLGLRASEKQGPMTINVKKVKKQSVATTSIKKTKLPKKKA